MFPFGSMNRAAQSHVGTLMTRSTFTSLSPTQRAVLTLALICWAVSFVWAILFLSRFVWPPDWPTIAAVLAVACGAFGTAAVTIEIARSISTRIASWSERRQFTWVGILFLVLFTIQYTGVRIAMSSYVTGAF